MLSALSLVPARERGHSPGTPALRRGAPTPAPLRLLPWGGGPTSSTALPGEHPPTRSFANPRTCTVFRGCGSSRATERLSPAAAPEAAQPALPGRDGLAGDLPPPPAPFRAAFRQNFPGTPLSLLPSPPFLSRKKMKCFERLYTNRHRG